MSDNSFDVPSTGSTPHFPEPGTIGTSDATASSDSSPRGRDVDRGTTGAVKDEAASVATDARASAQDVASNAGEQVKDVAAEAKSQAKDLLGQVRGEATEQASTQQQRLASGLRSLGEELASMADASQQSGMATDLAGQASSRLDDASRWLESREPGDVLSEVTDFARRRPGAFLATAAVVGFVGGRLTRSLTADGDSTSSSGSHARATPAGPGPSGSPHAAAPAPTPPSPATEGESSGATPGVARAAGIVESDPTIGRPA